MGESTDWLERSPTERRAKERSEQEGEKKARTCRIYRRVTSDVVCADCLEMYESAGEGG